MTDRIIKDYILLMLGCPVVVVPLGDVQMDLAIKTAKWFVNHYADVHNLTEHGEQQRLEYIQYGSYIYAKSLIAKCRDKRCEICKMYDAVIEEAIVDLAKWKEEVKFLFKRW